MKERHPEKQQVIFFKKVVGEVTQRTAIRAAVGEDGLITNGANSIIGIMVNDHKWTRTNENLVDYFVIPK